MPKYDYRLPKHDITNESIHVDDLAINPNAQRAVGVARAKRMANNFLPQAAGTLVVCRRDGLNYVVDGMHRLAAARMAGVTTMSCEVHHGLSEEHEAELFLIKNKESKAPSKLDEYRIGLVAQHPLFVAVQEVLDRHELKMANAPTTNQIGAVQAVVGILEQHGAEVLDATLKAVQVAFGRRDETWEGTLLQGTAMFIARHLMPPTAIEVTQLGERMAALGPVYSWKGRITAAATENGTTATGTKSRASAAYRLIVSTWNKGRSPRNRIQLPPR